MVNGWVPVFSTFFSFSIRPCKSLSVMRLFAVEVSKLTIVFAGWGCMMSEIDVGFLTDDGFAYSMVNEIVSPRL